MRIGCQGRGGGGKGEGRQAGEVAVRASRCDEEQKAHVLMRGLPCSGVQPARGKHMRLWAAW